MAKVQHIVNVGDRQDARDKGVKVKALCGQKRPTREPSEEDGRKPLCPGCADVLLADNNASVAVFADLTDRLADLGRIVVSSHVHAEALADLTEQARLVLRRPGAGHPVNNGEPEAPPFPETSPDGGAPGATANVAGSEPTNPSGEPDPEAEPRLHPTIVHAFTTPGADPLSILVAGALNAAGIDADANTSDNALASKFLYTEMGQALRKVFRAGRDRLDLDSTSGDLGVLR